MEIKPGSLLKKLRNLLQPLLLLSVLGGCITAQPPVRAFVVKKGNIYVTLSKTLSEQVLDSFIVQYDLQELDLKTFFKTSRPDSLHKLGWQVELNNNEMVVVSKPMKPVDKLNDPAEKIMMAQKRFNNGYGVANKEPMYGYNRFTRKYPFAVQDSLVTFYFRANTNADRVMLAGTFNGWDPEALSMKRVDSGWIAVVKLGPGKHYYKFIVDGNWTIDKDNPLFENDGQGNDNSVYYKTNYVFSLAGYPAARMVSVAGSFNEWKPDQIRLNKTTTGWQANVYLAEGTHTYRFIADGKWFADPANPDQFPNEFDETNSVVRIGKPYLFHVKGFPNAQRVMLMGSFNQWRNYELAMQKTDSGWVLPYVLGHGNYEYTYEVDGQKPVDPVTGKPQPIRTLILAPNVTFRLKGFDHAKTVFLSGDFNHWTPNGFPMSRKGEEWVIQQHLKPGKHVYKFIVDGKWLTDPANKLREPNEFGQENSVIWVEE
jgi:1,4-alpha-glucan branching enzyme